MTIKDRPWETLQLLPCCLEFGLVLKSIPHVAVYIFKNCHQSSFHPPCSSTLSPSQEKASMSPPLESGWTSALTNKMLQKWGTVTSEDRSEDETRFRFVHWITCAMESWATMEEVWLPKGHHAGEGQAIYGEARYIGASVSITRLYHLSPGTRYTNKQSLQRDDSSSNKCLSAFQSAQLRTQKLRNKD